jgi:hypothetical protein
LPVDLGLLLAGGRLGLDLGLLRLLELEPDE